MYQKIAKLTLEMEQEREQRRESYSSTMAEGETASLKKALSSQLQIIRRLNAELEDEREASASGANEALTMMLRLQKEKAEEKREASQYRKMAESKLQHAEESLIFFEELVFLKDIEIESLKHKVQSYKKVLQYARQNENIHFPSSSFLEKTNSCIQIKRQTSEITLTHEDGSLLPAIDTIWREIGEQPSFDLKQEKELYLSSCHSQFSGSLTEAEATKLETPSRRKRFTRSKSTKVYLQEPLAGIPESRDSTPILKEMLTNFQPNCLVHNDFERLKYQVQELADDVRCMKQGEMWKEDEQINLLRLIHEQLKSIYSHIKSWKSRKFCPKDEDMFISLKEAMLSFWI